MREGLGSREGVHAERPDSVNVASAQEKLDAVWRLAEKMFEVGPDGVSAIAATGERFIVICCGGMKEEGALSPAYAGTPEIAITLWMTAFREYAEPRGDYLYWRSRPEIDVLWVVPKNTPKTFALSFPLWMVYSRLVVSKISPRRAAA